MWGETEGGIVFPVKKEDLKPEPKSPDAYLTHWKEDYERPDHIGYASIEVLEFLKGRKWDQLALNWVHSVRPSCIRVTDCGVTCDAWGWRVTVYVDKDKTIKKITQEVEVGLTGGYENGHDLTCKTDGASPWRD